MFLLQLGMREAIISRFRITLLIFTFFSLMPLFVIGFFPEWKETFFSFFLSLQKSPGVKILVYFLICFFTSFLVLPLGVVTKLLGGWLFGFWAGSAISLFSLTLGSWVCFKVSRSFALPQHLDKAHKKIAEINNRLAVSGFRSVLQMRLFPFFPMQGLNVLLGLSNVKTKDFVLGSFFGMIPAVGLYSFLGAQLDQINRMDISWVVRASVYLILFGLFVLSFLGISQSDQIKIHHVSEELKKVYPDRNSRAWDEQAVPSYLHSHWIMRYIFWKRIRSAAQFMKPNSQILDFGCGLGASFPWIVPLFSEVWGFDRHTPSIESARLICRNMNWSNVHLSSNEDTLSQMPAASFDCILALDVLEHVDQLPAVLAEFKRILKPGGYIVVSSPTENFVYRFARRFGGKGYQGEFHLRAAREVEADIQKYFVIQKVKKIFPVFTFFRIVKATRE